MKILKTALLACALAGCATTNVPSSENVNKAKTSKQIQKQKKTSFEYVKEHTKFTEDRHIRARTAAAPEIKYKDPNRNIWTDGYVFYQLIGIDGGRSGTDKINYSDIQIRMRQTSTGDWSFYSSAYTEGKKLGFTKIDRNVSCLSGTCYKKETFGIDMTMEQLKAASDGPAFSFKVIGKGTSTVVEIPQSYITGFLAAIEEQQES